MMSSSVMRDDLRGYSRLAADAVVQTTDLVEAMHATIVHSPWPWQPRVTRTRGITGFVYSCVRGVMHTVGSSVDLGWSGVLPLLEELTPTGDSSASRDVWLGVVNGVIGDHLEASGNSLALPMTFRCGAHDLTLQAGALRDELPGASGNKLVVFIHGLCMTDVQWARNSYSHADQLVARQGYTALQLRYNSGLHISTNGRELADQLERLVDAWPVAVTELTIVGHSLGGLLARSACHYANLQNQAWLAVLKNIVFLGTPQHGAPLERYGNHLQSVIGFVPYAAPLARLGMLRSAGVTDLRHSNLLEQDWAFEDRFARHDDHRRHLPLPDGVRCFALAATLGRQRGDWRDRWLGDGLVPVASGLGQHIDPARSLGIPEDSQRLLLSTGHLQLLSRPEVGSQIARWLSQA